MTQQRRRGVLPVQGHRPSGEALQHGLPVQDVFEGALDGASLDTTEAGGYGGWIVDANSMTGGAATRIGA